MRRSDFLYYEPGPRDIDGPAAPVGVRTRPAGRWSEDRPGVAAAVTPSVPAVSRPGTGGAATARRVTAPGAGPSGTPAGAARAVTDGAVAEAGGDAEDVLARLRLRASLSAAAREAAAGAPQEARDPWTPLIREGAAASALGARAAAAAKDSVGWRARLRERIRAVGAWRLIVTPRAALAALACLAVGVGAVLMWAGRPGAGGGEQEAAAVFETLGASPGAGGSGGALTDGSAGRGVASPGSAAGRDGGSGSGGSPEATAAQAGSGAAAVTDPGGASSADQGGAVGVVAHVAGAVAAPGLVRLAAGARVGDAIAAAGGAAAHADLDRVNLARAVTDGEQIYVPKKGEKPGGGAAGAAGAGAVTGGGGAGATEAASSGTAGLVDINHADAAALQALPGIGPALAKRIIDHREANGPFRSVAGLTAVSGIGPAVLQKLSPKATAG